MIDGFAEELSYSRFDGEPAVMIQVFRIGDQKILDLVSKVRSYVDSTEAWLPDGLKLTV